VDHPARPTFPDDVTRALLAAIVDSSDDVIVSKTLDGQITSWNRAAERLFGWAAEEAIGRSITLIIPDDRRAEEEDVLARLRRGEHVDHFETVRVTKDGRRVDVSITVSPVRDGTGRVVGASKIARDITPRRDVERVLATTVQRLDVLYRLADGVARAKEPAEIGEAAVEAIMATGASRASVLTFDEAGVMRFRAWRHLSDSYRAAVEGHSPWARDAVAPAPVLVPDALADPDLGQLREVIAAEGVRALAFIPLVHQGRLLGKFMLYYDAVHACSPPEIRLAETIAQHVAFGLARLEAEAAIQALLAREQAARREADAANRGKDEFLAVLSHELRTPLNAILGWARMLRGSALSDAQRANAIEVIERNAELQGELIGDLIDISRIAAGKMEIEREPVDLVLVAREAVDGLSAEITAKQLRLDLELDDRAGEVLGDGRRLRQVISNLLSNAIKFTPAGGRLGLRLARHDASARVTVTDTGEGIDPAMLTRIFDRFEQGDSSTTRKHHGLGLGLAIVRQLVELHGGTVLADSAGRGQGAVFTIDLPVLPVRIRRQAGCADAAPDLPQPAATLKGCRILVVDDQADARDLLAFVLARSGADVRVAASGAEALEAIAADTFDVLVSDIAMPDMDGNRLIEQVRTLVGPSLQAVAVTAHMGPTVRARALRAGFDACVTKPLEAEELIGLLERLRGLRDHP
jgi:PAS domain S-box-containing protein